MSQPGDEIGRQNDFSSRQDSRVTNHVVCPMLNRFFICCLLIFSICSTAQAAGVRNEALSLDGVWQIIFDDQNVGRNQRLFRSEIFFSHENRRSIDVPSVWERVEKDYEGVGFYYRTFEVPAAWDGKIVHLAFDAVNYRAEVYLNDNVVGAHEGGFTPFRFRVDSMNHLPRVTFRF